MTNETPANTAPEPEAEDIERAAIRKWIVRIFDKQIEDMRSVIAARLDDITDEAMARIDKPNDFFSVHDALMKNEDNILDWRLGGPSLSDIECDLEKWIHTELSALQAGCIMLERDQDMKPVVVTLPQSRQLREDGVEVDEVLCVCGLAIENGHEFVVMPSGLKFAFKHLLEYAYRRYLYVSVLSSSKTTSDKLFEIKKLDNIQEVYRQYGPSASWGHSNRNTHDDSFIDLLFPPSFDDYKEYEEMFGKKKRREA